MGRLTRLPVVLLGLYLSTMAWAAHSALTEAKAARIESERYAIDSKNCVLLDGYVCSEDPQETYSSAESQLQMISGNLLKAWQVALSNFQNQSDQNSEQTNLKHFKIGFSQNPNQFIILFQGLLLPRIENAEPVGITNITLGRTTRYWISKTTYEIEKRLFYK